MLAARGRKMDMMSFAVKSLKLCSELFTDRAHDFFTSVENVGCECCPTIFHNKDQVNRQ